MLSGQAGGSNNSSKPSAPGGGADQATSATGDSLPDPASDVSSTASSTEGVAATRGDSQGDGSKAQVSGVGQELSQLKEAIDKNMEMMKKNPSLAEKVSAMRNFIPPENMVTGASVNHADFDK